MKSKIVLGLLASFLFVAYSAAVYSLGSSKATATVTAAWKKENSRRDIKTAQLEEVNKVLMAQHQKDSSFITTELKTYEAQYKISLASATADYNRRLQQHQTRAGIYRELAEGSTAERDGLASHAAELDRSLEEGRSVVRELRETVGLRDNQLRELGKQIMADRALLN